MYLRAWESLVTRCVVPPTPTRRLIAPMSTRFRSSRWALGRVPELILIPGHKDARRYRQDETKSYLHKGLVIPRTKLQVPGTGLYSRKAFA